MPFWLLSYVSIDVKARWYLNNITTSWLFLWKVWTTPCGIGRTNTTQVPLLKCCKVWIPPRMWAMDVSMHTHNLITIPWGRLCVHLTQGPIWTRPPNMDDNFNCHFLNVFCKLSAGLYKGFLHDASGTCGAAVFSFLSVLRPLSTTLVWFNTYVNLSNSKPLEQENEGHPASNAPSPQIW